MNLPSRKSALISAKCLKSGDWGLISIPSAGKLAEEIAIAIEADINWEEGLVIAVKTEIRAHLNGEDFK